MFGELSNPQKNVTHIGMTMELLGRDLAYFLETYKTFSLGTVLNIGKQVVGFKSRIVPITGLIFC